MATAAARKEAVKILLVEDMKTDAELEMRELRRAGIPIDCRIVEDEPGFREALERFRPDLIISDFAMPNFDGMAALALARDLAPETPFMFVSGTIGEEYAVRALRNGATDYVLKGNLLRLPAAVERALDEAIVRREKGRVQAELESARQRLDAIFQNLQDVLWSVGLPDENLLYVSSTSTKVYGHGPEHFLKDRSHWLQVVHPEDRALMASAWSALKEGTPLDLECRIVRPDGAVRWLHYRGMLVRDNAGQPERMEGVARDVSERMQERLRLERLSRVREMLGAVNAAVVRLRDRNELLQEICRVATRLGALHLASALMKESDGLIKRVAAEGNGAQALPNALSDASVPVLAIDRGEAIVRNDVRDDERLRESMRTLGARSCAAFPLRAEDRIIGSLGFASTEANGFDDENVALLSELAGNVSFALDLIAKRAQLDYISLHDPLTGLHNRTSFQERLAWTVGMAKSEQRRLALVALDIDRFKLINDSFGNHAGDELLREFGRRLRALSRDIDLVARIGGNQFALMVPNVEAAVGAVRFLGEIKEAIGQPFSAGGHEVHISARAGIAVFPDDSADAQLLFKNAEAALKRAKETAEPFLFYAPHINERVSEQFSLERRLREAVARNELLLHYQPKVELASRRIVGFEALLRWHPAQGSPVSPAQFVPILEQTGMILEVGKQIIARAANDRRALLEKGLDVPRIAVNVSARQLRQKTFVRDVQNALGGRESGIDLEITESLLMDDVEASIVKLRELRDFGLKISLDDFGTGFSSLAYLHKLPIDLLKIDRSFVRGMMENADDTSIISAIISLAQALRLQVIAEGVETEQQATLLRLLRCDQIQGYLFSKPVPIERVDAMLRALPGTHALAAS